MVADSRARRPIFTVFMVHNTTMARQMARPVVLCTLFMHSSTGLAADPAIDALGIKFRGPDAPLGTDP